MDSLSYIYLIWVMGLFAVLGLGVMSHNLLIGTVIIFETVIVFPVTFATIDYLWKKKRMKIIENT